MKRTDWFLTAEERGNPATTVDRRHPGTAWSEGNLVVALAHGRQYFERLLDVLGRTAVGDLILFTDWRGDGDERLAGAGTEVVHVLSGLPKRGVLVRGLIWRSHPDQIQFSEQENLGFAEIINAAGGEVFLDERVRRVGSHHQKLVVVRRRGRPDDDVAFVGGIDLCHGRNDDVQHQGDPQAVAIDDRYGPRPAWHDLQLEVRGPVIDDLAETFRERWEDPLPLARGPWRRRLARAAGQPVLPTPLPVATEHPGPIGPHAVQVLRTYPAKRPASAFAPKGERSIARAYTKAFGRARRLIYVEDQYLWSFDAARSLGRALRREPELLLVVVVPKFPDDDGWLTGPPNRIGQLRVITYLQAIAGPRVAVYNLEVGAVPVYVHAKVCVVDDVWMTVGSDNFNRRSWTHDSEISCAILDDTLDAREPADPAGRGDGARVLARSTRLALWQEHLGRADVPVDPDAGFALMRASADALDAWHEAGRVGVRPPGRVRNHRPTPVPMVTRPFARAAYHFVSDPDGRGWACRSRRSY